jgi:hypothetical protein
MYFWMDTVYFRHGIVCNIVLVYCIKHCYKPSENHVQGDWKVTQPIPDTCSFCQKLNCIKIRKQKAVFCWALEMSVAFNDACIHSFVWSNLVKSSCISETACQTAYCRIVWHRIIVKCVLAKVSQNEMPDSVWYWKFVAPVKESSLHISCWKSADRLALTGYSMTWPAWALE